MESEVATGRRARRGRPHARRPILGRYGIKIGSGPFDRLRRGTITARIEDPAWWPWRGPVVGEAHSQPEEALLLPKPLLINFVECPAGMA